jgi:hypothetical protein
MATVQEARNGQASLRGCDADLSAGLVPVNPSGQILLIGDHRGSSSTESP